MVYPRINITQLQKILSSDVQIEDFNINKSYPTNIIILKNNELYYSLTTTTQGEFKEDEWVKILSITDLDKESEEIIKLLNIHVANKNNPHNVTKAQLGLGNVDNTTDINKPISNATQLALDAKADKSDTYTKDETINLLNQKLDIDAASETYETITNVNLHINDKDNPHNVTKAQLGLENVDNTTDINKPISNATQLALDTKADKNNTYTKDETDGSIKIISDKIDESIKTVSDKIDINDSEIKKLNLSVNSLQTNKADASDLNSHINNNDNPHNVTKTQLGLENVDNTSDLNKPISNATQIALDAKADKNNTYTKDEVGEFLNQKLDIDAASETYETITNVNLHINNNDNPHNVTKLQLGLSDVDNTSDLNKPISNATQIALDTKADKNNTYTKDEVDESIRTVSDKIDETITNVNSHINNNDNPHNVTKAQLGLENIDNTSDLNKPISNATQLALDTKADKSNIYTKDEIDGKISSVYRFKGSIKSENDLPLSNQMIGDVYNVEDTGANYAWNGSYWDKLSETVDLSSYLTKDIASETYETITNVNSHINNKNNPHNVTKAQLGLSNVNNTSDLNKPISNATQLALDAKQDIATAINYNNITNCITEIPQDIKMELANGVLTLKIGSKVYMPDGVNVYNEFIADKDLTYTAPTSSGSGQQMLFWAPKTGGLIASAISKTVSGSTDSLSGTTYHTWWNITDNIINRYGSDATNPVHQLTLPLCLYTVTDGIITSIDQVFNGFGYIGSCVFTLPGVKGLYPNGRNEDGTLKNGLINCTTVQVSSNFNDTIEHTLMINPNGRCEWYSTTGWHYNDIANVMVASSGTVLTSATLGTFKTTNGTISNFNPYEVFHAVDYSEYISSKKSLDGKVSELDNKVSQKVNKSGDTMTGNLGILDSDVIFRDTQTAVAPSTDTWHKSILQFLDKTGERVGWIQPFFKTDGTMELRFVSCDPVNGNKYLNLGSNGNLVWNGKPVITTSGGTFTGNIAIQKETPQINLKSTVMDITSGDWAAGRNTIAWCMDKNGYESAGVYNTTDSDGTARATLYVMSRKTGSQVQASLGVGVNSSGQTYATAPNTPSGAGSNEVVTASWAKSKFLPLAGGTMSGVITTKSQIIFEHTSSTGHRGFLYKTSDGSLSMGIAKSDNSGWQSYQSFITSGQYQIAVSDGTNLKYLIAKSDGTLTWDGKQIVRLVAEQKATSANNYKWYRKYSDGWVEQGGMQNIGNSNRTVLFPIAMADKDAYDLQLTVIDRYRYACVANTSEKETTRIVVTTGDDSSANNDGTINWYVCGYAA